MARRGSGLTLLAGILIGGAVGAAAGILFAPAAGEETRRILKKKADRLSKDLSEKAVKLSKEVQKKAKEFNEESLEPLTKRVRTEVKGIRKSAKKVATRLVKKM